MHARQFASQWGNSVIHHRMNKHRKKNLDSSFFFLLL